MIPTDDQIATVRQFIDRRHDRDVDRWRRWCDQNSWSQSAVGLDAMADLLMDDFGGIGVDFEAVRLPDFELLLDDGTFASQPTGPALIWHHRPRAKRRVLLMIHYDTVYPPGSQPATCRVQDGQLIGPGVVDAKGGIAVIAAAIEAMLDHDVIGETGVSILLNPDEEIGSPASADLMRSIAKDFDAALLFEPPMADGAFSNARKGSGNFAVAVTGRSAHAGRDPERGRNAIVHAAALVAELAELNDPEGGLTVNIARINGGGPLNQVPDHALVQWNVRAADVFAVRRFNARFEPLLADFERNGFSIRSSGEFRSPPKSVTPEMTRLQTLVCEAGAAVDREIVYRDTGGACDGSKLAAFGLPNIDTMGVSGGNLHHPDEFAVIDSLTPAALTVIGTVARLSDPS